MKSDTGHNAIGIIQFKGCFRNIFIQSLNGYNAGASFYIFLSQNFYKATFFKRKQTVNKGFGKHKFMFGYCVYTCFFEPEQTGVETDNAGEIHRAGFKSIRHKIRNFFLMADASGTAGKKRFDQRNHIRFQYKSSNALRAEKPFVTGESESIDMHGFHVDWPYSAGLSRVYKKF